MTSSHRTPPLVHLALLGGVFLMLTIGGTVTFGSWGTFPVRTSAYYLASAIVLHAISRYVPRAGLAVRAMAWGVLVAMTLHVQSLLRPEVLLPLAAVATVDLVVHRTELTSDTQMPAGTAAKVIAGITSLAAIGLVTALVILARDAQVLTRLGAVVLIGWALTTVLALRPATRTPVTLLAGAGAFSISFLLLAGPVLPFGPLIAYWVAVLAVTAAVLASTFSHSQEAFDPDRQRHNQRVRPLPDPVLAPLAEHVRTFLKTGSGARELSTRVEAALDRDEGGRLISAMCEAQAKGTRPGRADRTRALAELLEIDLSQVAEEVG